MIYTLIYLLAALALLSLLQRVIPWLFYKRVRSGNSLEKTFDLFAISAFSALLVYNVQSLGLFTFISLAIALVVAMKFHNIGLTVLVALTVLSISLMV
jgi:hypothetical protein